MKRYWANQFLICRNDVRIFLSSSVVGKIVLLSTEAKEVAKGPSRCNVHFKFKLDVFEIRFDLTD